MILYNIPKFGFLLSKLSSTFLNKAQNIFNLLKIGSIILENIFEYKIYKKLLITSIFIFLLSRYMPFDIFYCYDRIVSWLILSILFLSKPLISAIWQWHIRIKLFLLKKISDLAFALNIMIILILLLLV